LSGSRKDYIQLHTDTIHKILVCGRVSPVNVQKKHANRIVIDLVSFNFGNICAEYFFSDTIVPFLSAQAIEEAADQVDCRLFTCNIINFIKEK
jgi:hypothetical protein